MYKSINVFARILITFYFVVKSFFFLRKIQPMLFAHDDSILLSDQDTNQFLVWAVIKLQIS